MAELKFISAFERTFRLIFRKRGADMEINITNLDENIYKQLKLIANKDATSINNVMIDALKNYVMEKELEYKKEMINFEEDEGYQQPGQ